MMDLFHPGVPASHDKESACSRTWNRDKLYAAINNVISYTCVGKIGNIIWLLCLNHMLELAKNTHIYSLMVDLGLW